MAAAHAAVMAPRTASRAGDRLGATGRATRIVTSTVGAILGVSGVEHGVGEVLQGNVAPVGMVFPSWPGSDFFRIFNGEPAFSLVPNLLATGILAILVGALVAIWAACFIARKNGGWVLMGLLVVQFLVGGGIAGIPAGIVAGLAGTRINAPLRWWRRRSPQVLRALAKAWAGSFVVCVVGWLLVFPGLSILGLYLGTDHPAIVPLILVTLALAMGFMIVAIVAGFARDVRSAAGPGPHRAGSSLAADYVDDR